MKSGAPKKKSPNKTLPQTVLSPRKITPISQPVQSSSQSKIQNLKKMVIVPGCQPTSLTSNNNSNSNQFKTTLGNTQALCSSGRLEIKISGKNKSKSKPRSKNKSSQHNFKSHNNNKNKNKLMTAVRDNKMTKKSSSNRLTKQFCEQLINWGIKTSSSCIVSQDKLTIQQFVQSLQIAQFNQLNSNKIKMKILDFVVKRRIVRDSEFQKLYQKLVQKFDQHQEFIKEILVQILAALDQ